MVLCPYAADTSVRGIMETGRGKEGRRSESVGACDVEDKGQDSIYASVVAICFAGCNGCAGWVQAG